MPTSAQAVAEHRQQQRAQAKDHEAFYAEVKRSDDPFGSMIEFIGRGHLSFVHEELKDPRES